MSTITVPLLSATLGQSRLESLLESAKLLNSTLELDDLLGLYNEGAIRPRVDKIFALAEAGAAHRFIQERRNVGKVLLQTA